MPKSLLNLTVKKYGPDYIHKKIYDGKVFIFNNSNYINNIINIVEQYFIEIFGIEIKTFLCDKDNLNFPEKEKLFLKFQNKIKLCRNISLNFLKFLNELGLSSELVFMDQSSLRYSPQKGLDPLESLFQPHHIEIPGLQIYLDKLTFGFLFMMFLQIIQFTLCQSILKKN